MVFNQRTDCVSSGRVQLEHAPYRNRINWINFNGALCLIVSISKGRVTWKDALGSLLPHPLLYLLLQILRVASRHDEMDALNQARLRLCIL
jgi:hypothetical protein